MCIVGLRHCVWAEGMRSRWRWNGNPAGGYLTTKMIAIATMLISWSAAQAQTSGCRALSEQIVYDLLPPRHARSVTVVTVGVSGSLSTLVTTGDGGFYGTSDLGTKWTRLNRPGWTQRWNNRNATRSASDPSFMYTLDYGRFFKTQRSQDGGHTWIVPKPTVEGLSEEETAFRLSRDHLRTFRRL